MWLPKTKITRNRKPRFTLESQLVRDDRTGCLEWRGQTVRGGYGYISVKRKKVMVHRLLFEKENGPVAAGLVVRHRCDNPKCCELEHLVLGTQKENIADKVAKNRQSKGENNGNAKVTEHVVRQMRKLYASGHTQTEISELFGVSQSSVSFIVLRKQWKHID